MTYKTSNQHEFTMSDPDFERISELAYLYTGIVFVNQKKETINSRLFRRLRELGLQSIADYFPLIDNESKPEVGPFIDAISTNLNPFFKEPHHFDYLASNLCSEWQNTNATTKKIRIWSAGCSTGEEPYSIAMTLQESLDLNNWDCDILATDLDCGLVDKGRQGIYDLGSIGSLALERKKQWFLSDETSPDVVKVKPELQEMVEFKCLNLLDLWPAVEPFDLIFCRNVALYFNEPSQAILFDRFADVLKNGGYLVLGHSEKLDSNCQRFKLVGKTIYQKIN